jgi:hypothetical protein
MHLRLLLRIAAALKQEARGWKLPPAQIHSPFRAGSKAKAVCRSWG